MISLTSIVRNAFLSRQKELERHDNEAEELQAGVLKYLLANGKNTAYGRQHGMGGMNVAEQLVEGGAHIGLLVGEVDGKGARGYPIHHTAAELQTGKQQQEHAGLEEHQRTGVG